MAHTCETRAGNLTKCVARVVLSGFPGGKKGPVRHCAAMPAPANRRRMVIHFGGCEVDLRAGELRRNGAKVKLQEQPLQILAMLLEHPGEIVTREELRARLWSADTFVDFDHGLNSAVKRLRDALGDSAEKPRFVETVGRRGYRFIAAL